jgi:hypothetical protein
LASPNLVSLEHPIFTFQKTLDRIIRRPSSHRQSEFLWNIFFLRSLSLSLSLTFLSLIALSIRLEVMGQQSEESHPPPLPRVETILALSRTGLNFIHLGIGNKSLRIRAVQSGATTVIRLRVVEFLVRTGSMPDVPMIRPKQRRLQAKNIEGVGRVVHIKLKKIPGEKSRVSNVFRLPSGSQQLKWG